MSTHRDPRATATGILVVGLVACGFVLLPSAALGAERFALPKELVVHVVAALACVATGRALIDRRLAPPLLAVLALAALAAVVAGGNAWEAARSAGLLASSFVVLLSARAAAPRALAIGCAAAVAAIACATILEAHGVIALSPLPPGGVIGNRNAVAHLIALALPLMIGVAQASRRWPLALIALASHALILTRCRGALLALAAGAVVALVVARPSRRLLPAAVALAVGAASAIALPNQLAWTAPYGATLSRLVELDRGSGHGRIVQDRATLAMAVDHPWLGVGPGAWSVRYPDYAAAGDASYQPAQLFPVNRLASSDWLGLLAALGLPALAALALFAARYARLAYDRRAIAALATLAVLGVLGAVDTVLGRAAPALVAAIALGALLPAAPLLAAPLPATPPPTAPRWHGLDRWPLAALALALAIPAARLAAAAWVYGDGAAVARLEAAARLAPGSLYFPTYLARRVLRDGDCRRGRALAAGVLGDFPQLVALRDLAHACDSTANDSGDRHAYDQQALHHHPPRQRDRLGVRPGPPARPDL